MLENISVPDHLNLSANMLVLQKCAESQSLALKGEGLKHQLCAQVSWAKRLTLARGSNSSVQPGFVHEHKLIRRDDISCTYSSRRSNRALVYRLLIDCMSEPHKVP